MQAYTAKKGRRTKDEADTENIDPFLKDYCKIIQSKAYRRLSDKTQVFSLPKNSHIRTRAVHTNEVIAISVEIAQILNLNVYMCMAIAAGHDIGHPPYGHFGERILTELNIKQKEQETKQKIPENEKKNFAFRHNKFSVIVAQKIERLGKGLNLNHETLEGILLHSRGKENTNTNPDKPQEFSVVMYADKIAYLFADVNDARRYGFLEKDPPEVKKIGIDQRQRIKTAINSLVEESKRKNQVSFSEGKIYENFKKLKDHMYENIYPKLDLKIQKTIIESTYDFFTQFYPEIDPITATALMTDREINYLNNDFLTAAKKPSADLISNFGVYELLPVLKNLKKQKTDITNPDLDWA